MRYFAKSRVGPAATQCKLTGGHAPLNFRRAPGAAPPSLPALLADFPTTTTTGLKVESALDTRSYHKGIKVSKAAMKCIDITRDQFHPEWNYTIRPRPPAKT
jgi:hypothetical protein